MLFLLNFFSRNSFPTTMSVQDLSGLFLSSIRSYLTVNHSVTFKHVLVQNRLRVRAMKRSFTVSSRRKRFFSWLPCDFSFCKRCRLQKLDEFKEFVKAASIVYNISVPSCENDEEQEDIEEDDI